MKKVRIPKPVKYRVQCPFNEEHVFDKVFKIEAGSENVESKVETFCPFCDNQVTVKVKGKAFPDEVVMRTLNRYDGD